MEYFTEDIGELCPQCESHLVYGTMYESMSPHCPNCGWDESTQFASATEDAYYTFGGTMVPTDVHL